MLPKAFCKQLMRLENVRIGLRQNSNILSKFKGFKEGDKVTVQRKITNEDVEAFARLSGDTNHIHFKNDHEKAIVHGAFLNGIVSAVIGTKLPGSGTLVVSQNLNFPNKCYVDEEVSVTVELLENRKIIKVKFICETVSDKKIVLHGDAKLLINK